MRYIVRKLSIIIVLALLLQIFIPAQVMAAEPEMTVVPDQINFGTVTVSTASPVEVVTITNNGDGNLEIYDVSLTGAYSVHFQITEDNATGVTLAQGSSATVGVQFKPLLTGNKTAYLRIHSNNPGGCYFYVELSGTGVSLTDVDLAISKLDNPDPVAPGHNLTYTINIANNGPNTASDVFLFDMYPTNAFSIQSTTTSQGTVSQFLPQWVLDILAQEYGITSLPPGYSFVTWDIGSLANGAVADLTIVTTVNPDIQLPGETPIRNRAYVVTNCSELNWGNNFADISTNVEASVPTTITLEPESAINQLPEEQTHTLTLTVKDQYGQGMVETVDLASVNGTLAISQITTGSDGTATFDISSSIAISDTIIATSNTIPSLSATATKVWVGTPDIDVNPLTVNFGSIQVGLSSLPATVTVANTGDAALNISSVVMSNPEFSIFGASIAGVTLQPGDSIDVFIVFTPTTDGVRSGTMSIFSNDPDVPGENPVDVALSGNGYIITPATTTTTLPTTTPPTTPPTTTPSTTLTSQLYFTVDFLGKITRVPASADGRPLEDVVAYSPDNFHLLEIEAGTGATDSEGNAVTYITIRKAQAGQLPENTELVGDAYNITPSGTVFDKPVKLTLGFKMEDLSEETVSIGTAYLDSTLGWTYLESVRNQVAGAESLTSTFNHLTVFAILARLPEETSTTVTPPEQPNSQQTAPAAFVLDNLSITTSASKTWKNLVFVARYGEDAAIIFDVTNSGGQAGTHQVFLLLNGARIDSVTLDLEPGEMQHIVFKVVGNEPGTYTVQVGELTGEFESSFWINWWLIAGFTAAFILLVWLAIYLIRSRMRRAF
jgi:uncharacterized repeat protein (TIGR01451 family)